MYHLFSCVMISILMNAHTLAYTVQLKITNCCSEDLSIQLLAYSNAEDEMQSVPFDVPIKQQSSRYLTLQDTHAGFYLRVIKVTIKDLHFHLNFLTKFQYLRRDDGGIGKVALNCRDTQVTLEVDSALHRRAKNLKFKVLD